MVCPEVTTINGQGGPMITDRPLPYVVEHLMRMANMDNETEDGKMQDCFKVCITNHTGYTFASAPKVTTTTEVAYIEGVTARSFFYFRSSSPSS